MTRRHRPGRVAFVAALALTLAACDWTGFGFDAAHTRATTDPGPPMRYPQLLNHVWTGRTGANASSPVTGEDTVFVTTSAGKLLAFASTMTIDDPDCEWISQCRPRWSADLGAPSSSTPTVDHATVFAASNDGSVRAFDARGDQNCAGTPRVCAPRFRTAPVGPIVSSPQVVGDTLFVGSTDAALYAFDARGVRNCASGVCTPLWRAPVGGAVRSSPAVAGGTVYIGSDDGRLSAFDASGVESCSGGVCRAHWTSAAGSPIRSSPAVAGGTVYIGSDDGRLSAFDAAGRSGCSGTPLICAPTWSASTGAAVVAAPAIADGRVVVGSDDGNLRAFDADGETGCAGAPRVCAPLWRAPMDGAVRGSPAIAGHVVYAAAIGGELAAYDLAGTRNCAGTPRLCLPLWATRVPTPVSAPAIARGQVFVGAADLHVFRVVTNGSSDELRSSTLTAERADTYDLALDADAAGAHAPAGNVGGNTRVTFTRAGIGTSTDQYSCATWASDSSWHDQEGAALRVRPVTGGVSAITVTKNVFFGANWKFNVHVWDTSRSPAAIQIGAFDLGPVFAPDEIHVEPLPWKLCAQVVGSTVSFVVWPASEPRPAWGDPTHGGSVTLPAGYAEPGEVGWYIGHLEPDHRAEFTGLDAGPLTGSGAPLADPNRKRRTAPRAPTAIPGLP
jgi:outer membrane protein assembly factor BamB